MTSDSVNAARSAANIVRVLEKQGISYALGGALAFAIHAEARGTRDVDLNLFLEADALGPGLDALAEAGVSFDREAASRDAADGGMFIGWDGACRIDVFTPSIAFSREAERTRVRSHIEGQPAWFLSAESLAVFKLLFFRTKDLADLERLVAAQGPRLDAPWVRRWIVEMMEEDDPRVAAWDDLVRRFGGAR